MTEAKHQDYWILLAWPARRSLREADPEDESIWGSTRPVFISVGGGGELAYLLVFTSEQKALEYATTVGPENPDVRIRKPLHMTGEEICEQVFNGDSGGCLVLDRDPNDDNPIILDAGYLLTDEYFSEVE